MQPESEAFSFTFLQLNKNNFIIISDYKQHADGEDPVINHRIWSTELMNNGLISLCSFWEKKVYVVDLSKYFALSIKALVIKKECQFCYSAQESTPKTCYFG